MHFPMEIWAKYFGCKKKQSFWGVMFMSLWEQPNTLETLLSNSITFAKNCLTHIVLIFFLSTVCTMFLVLEIWNSNKSLWFKLNREKQVTFKMCTTTKNIVGRFWLLQPPGMLNASYNFVSKKFYQLLWHQILAIKNLDVTTLSRGVSNKLRAVPKKTDNGVYVTTTF